MVDGCVYECDGRKDFPINHGTAQEILGLTPTSTTTSSTTATATDNKLLESAICVIQKEFMSVDPEELRFTFVALTDAAVE